MKSRMDRYKEETNSEVSLSRSNRNQELYKDISTNTKYMNFSDVTSANAIDLNKARENYHTREGYQAIKEYNAAPLPKEKKELDEINYLYQDHENKVYDINSVLEEARKNRQDKDNLETKRKLKDTNYNILASLNPKELEKYKEEKKERSKPNEKELRNLIDTITSKTLAGELDQQTSVNLLSDLMATNVVDKVPEEDAITCEEDSEEKLSLSKEILDKDELSKMQKLNNTSTIMKEADTDFYTRSMDLSDKDFSEEEEAKEKHVPVVVKILLILVLLAVVTAAIYFIWKSF